MRRMLSIVVLSVAGCMPMDEYYVQDYDSPQWLASGAPAPAPNVCAASAAPNGVVTPVSASAPSRQTSEPELLRR